MFDQWKNTSVSNFDIYNEIFAVLPNNEVFAMPDKGLFAFPRNCFNSDPDEIRKMKMARKQLGR